MGPWYLRESLHPVNRVAFAYRYEPQTPRWPPPHRDNMLRFDVRVRLPASETGSSLILNSLVTKMPNFQHRVHKLAETTRFDKLVLETSNSQIDVDVRDVLAFKGLVR